MNPALELRDIHAAAAPGFWPPAPGWWVLATISIIAIIFLLRFTIKFLQTMKKRRQVLALLDAIALNEQGSADFVARISTLLRRAALEKFGSAEVAGLNGSDWLAFLDRTGETQGFSNGCGTVLATGPYTRSPEVNPQQLTQLCKHWLRKNIR